MRNPLNKKELQKKTKIKNIFRTVVFRIWWFNDAVQWHLLLFCYRSKIKLKNLNKDEIDSLIRIFIIDRIKILNVPADLGCNVFIFLFFLFFVFLSKTLGGLKTVTITKRDFFHSLSESFAKFVAHQWFGCNAKNVGLFYFKPIVVRLTKKTTGNKKDTPGFEWHSLENYFRCSFRKFSYRFTGSILVLSHVDYVSSNAAKLHNKSKCPQKKKKLKLIKKFKSIIMDVVYEHLVCIHTYTCTYK